MSVKKSKKNSDVKKQGKKISPEEFTEEFLRNISIPVKLKGYNYLAHAIIMSIEDHNMLDGITKALYPAVAKKNRSTPAGVERAMRHALERTWIKGGGKYYYQLLNNGDSGPKPTNGEFISSAVKLYEQRYNCNLSPET